MNGRVIICGSLAYTFPCGEDSFVCVGMYSLPALQMLPSATIISEAPEINVRQLEGNWLLVCSSVLGKGHKKIGISYI